MDEMVHTREEKDQGKTGGDLRTKKKGFIAAKASLFTGLDKMVLERDRHTIQM